MENISDCPNGYTEETFMESFGKDNNDIKKCNSCSNFTYDEGICSCKKFSNEE